MSPTQRSLKYLRASGYAVGIVERWIERARKRIDLFGFIDLVAVRGDETLGVQTTSGQNLAARIAKAKALPEFRAWINTGNVVEFHGWRKLSARTVQRMNLKTRTLWHPHIVRVTAAEEVEL